MTVTTDSFIAAFPEFSDGSVYPPSAINSLIGFAPVEMNVDKLGTAADLGTMLYIAHNLVLGARDGAAAAIGGIPGQSGGIPSSKSVGGVSVSFSATSTADPKAGAWNATTYGQRLYRLLRSCRLGSLYVVR